MGKYEAGEAILHAAAEWKTRCLLNGRSMFTDRPLWIEANFEALDRYYVQNLDEGDGSFFQKLEKQLAQAPAAATQLAAEMFWVLFLIVTNSAQGGATKRLQIRQVWEWSGEPLPADSPWLGEVLDHGVSNPGPAYNTHRWRELLFFITLMGDWVALPLQERGSLLSDPWAFADWLEAREHAKGRQFRHVLLFLLFPSHFERVLTGSQKVSIAKAFSAQLGIAAPVDYADRIAVDRRVLLVRESLERDAGDGEVDFYGGPYRSVWAPPEPEPPPPPGGGGAIAPSEAEAAEWLNKRFGERGIWVIGAGQGGRLWPSFVQEGIAAIGWGELGDLSEYPTKDAIGESLAKWSGQPNPFNDTLALWQFSHEMQVGDVLIAKKGRSGLLGWGHVIGEYELDPQRSEYHHTRKVRWEMTTPVTAPKSLGGGVKTLTEVRRDPQFVRHAFDLMERSDEKSPVKVGGEPVTYTPEQALMGLFLPPSQFHEILDALGRTKAVILQGPPGVGKTFIAKRLAWSLIGRQDPTAVEMVQFHQSYAYEDFIQGWRPTQSGGFRLRNGVFYDFCKRAEAEPGKSFVFIIDEINRGNLSKIFGELLMLVEADKRGPEYAVPLTYSESGERFSAPPNVYLLGMMNTADRSLAMVDYALRRRFAFITLQPAFAAEAFQDYLLKADVSEELVGRITRRLLHLNEQIRADSKNLGPGFEIGHSYFVPTGDEESLEEDWYRSIVRTQVEPLLREYWFDKSAQVDGYVAELLG